ncbi:protein kinase domain-containing protein [Lentibacillus sp. Marseille-P4043]|uniref:protein kinase domain-containing protein n=1 Tax=Lentibacillus sp. Marseille-P4043 TaxID=2040293 RepID=UPI000D0BBBE4|nr:protein kinase [Lentibacillus sp. Marseille-P4043]
MDQYYITNSDVHEVLNQHGLIARDFGKLPRSGQRQVFEVEFNTKRSSMLKFVDVSSYYTYQRLEWNDLSDTEFEHEKEYEIEARSKRIIRELEASKKCPILPQLEILDGYQIFTTGNYNFIYYFETKFEGKTLDKSDLYQSQQDINTVVEFLLQMVKQIRIMHDAGYVHRDLTPRNIIYYQGEYKIIDAGLVKSNDEEKLTATRVEIGTPYYMAPEQAKRTSDYTWDFRTDLFSVGLIAIEIFLPKSRILDKKDKRDLHFIFQIWKDKDSSPKSIYLFSKVIARLAIEQRHKRWSDLDELLSMLENLTREDIQ